MLDLEACKKHACDNQGLKGPATRPVSLQRREKWWEGTRFTSFWLFESVPWRVLWLSHELVAMASFHSSPCVLPSVLLSFLLLEVAGQRVSHQSGPAGDQQSQAAWGSIALRRLSLLHAQVLEGGPSDTYFHSRDAHSSLFGQLCGPFTECQLASSSEFQEGSKWEMWKICSPKHGFPPLLKCMCFRQWTGILFEIQLITLQSF